MKTKKRRQSGNYYTGNYCMHICAVSIYMDDLLLRLRRIRDLYSSTYIRSKASDNGWIYQYVYDRDCYI